MHSKISNIFPAKYEDGTEIKEGDTVIYQVETVAVKSWINAYSEPIVLKEDVKLHFTKPKTVKLLKKESHV